MLLRKVDSHCLLHESQFRFEKIIFSYVNSTKEPGLSGHGPWNNHEQPDILEAAADMNLNYAISAQYKNLSKSPYLIKKSSLLPQQANKYTLFET